MLLLECWEGVRGGNGDGDGGTENDGCWVWVSVPYTFALGVDDSPSASSVNRLSDFMSRKGDNEGQLTAKKGYIQQITLLSFPSVSSDGGITP